MSDRYASPLRDTHLVIAIHRPLLSLREAPTLFTLSSRTCSQLPSTPHCERKIGLRGGKTTQCHVYVYPPNAPSFFLLPYFLLISTTSKGPSSSSTTCPGFNASVYILSTSWGWKIPGLVHERMACFPGGSVRRKQPQLRIKNVSMYIKHDSSEKGIEKEVEEGKEGKRNSKLTSPPQAPPQPPHSPSS